LILEQSVDHNKDRSGCTVTVSILLKILNI